MIGLTLLLLAQVAPAAAPASREEIIVVGRRAEQALAACLARHCPPAEEVETSLQASVEQFAGGRYVDARRTLQNAIGRNRNHAADLPGPVSSLYATLATVAEHMGDTNLWRWSALNNVQVLRRYAGENNIATLAQELALGDNMVGLGDASGAENAYLTVQRKAVESGNSELAAGAAFRRAWLALSLERNRDAEKLADEAVRLAGANNRQIVELRDILHTRIAIQRGDAGAVDTLATRLRQSATGAPTLIFAPPIDDINPPNDIFKADPWHDPKIRFADVGYWIRPDGRTSGAEILRTSGLGQWAPGILRQVGQRRYAPFDVEQGSPGNYRIDRFTVRGTLGTPTGTRIPQRMGKLTIHVVDLTETDAMTVARREHSSEVLANPES